MTSTIFIVCMFRPPLDLLDHHDQEPLRISFHEEERDLDVSSN